jgi:hypothetical protein
MFTAAQLIVAPRSKLEDIAKKEKREMEVGSAMKSHKFQFN